MGQVKHAQHPNPPLNSTRVKAQRPIPSMNQIKPLPNHPPPNRSRLGHVPIKPAGKGFFFPHKKSVALHVTCFPLLLSAPKHALTECLCNCFSTEMPRKSGTIFNNHCVPTFGARTFPQGKAQNAVHFFHNSVKSKYD